MVHECTRVHTHAPTHVHVHPVPAGTLPASLATLPHLSVLSLGGNRLSGQLDDFVAGLPLGNQLSVLNVSSNRLTGQLPLMLAQLGMFTM